MKYFILTMTSKQKVRGRAYPPAEILSAGDIEGAPGYAAFFRTRVPEDKALPQFQLRKSAKEIDLISGTKFSIPAYGVISKKFVELLKGFHHPTSQILPLSVKSAHGEPLDYYLFHQYIFMDEYLDFNRNIYLRTIHDFSVTPYDVTEETFQVANITELYEEIRGKKGSVSTKALYLNTAAIQHDFFIISQPRCWVVSEKVAEKLQAENIMGIALLPLEQGDDFSTGGIVHRAHKLGL